MQKLDCKAVRDFKLALHKEEIKKLGVQPKLTIIQVGDRADSNRYVANKAKRAEECGIKVNIVKLKENISQEKLENIVFGEQSMCDSIIIQCPLPKHINEKEVLSLINPMQDCDGLTKENIGYLHYQEPRIIPATAQGILDLLDYYKIDVTGMDILLIGRSNLVNRPLQEALTQRNATCTLAHSKTKNLQQKLESGYDMVIGAIGQDRFLKNVDAKYIIDVGINVDENGKLHGDFDIDTCSCEYYTPVPSGVGLLTTHAIVGNIVKCFKLLHNKID